jgi:hypothetical protein
MGLMDAISCHGNHQPPFLEVAVMRLDVEFWLRLGRRDFEIRQECVRF